MPCDNFRYYIKKYLLHLLYFFCIPFLFHFMQLLGFFVPYHAISHCTIISFHAFPLCRLSTCYLSLSHTSIHPHTLIHALVLIIAKKKERDRESSLNCEKNHAERVRACLFHYSHGTT